MTKDQLAKENQQLKAEIVTLKAWYAKAIRHDDRVIRAAQQRQP